MGKGHVLIVDHEESLVKSLVGLLRDEGFTVSCASDGNQALPLIREEAPDLILLDIWLPGMDGIETLQALHSMRTDIKVIVISGHGNIETAVKATKLGAFDYIEKPFSPDFLLWTMHRALNHDNSGQRQDSSVIPPASTHDLIGDSPQIEALRRQLAYARTCHSPVLIRGEAGSERDLVAHLLHRGSQHQEGAFVTCYCDGLSAHEAERMLFGAISDRQGWNHTPTRGYLELANGGTAFLDGIEFLQPEIQQKLLYAITTRTLRRVGGKVPIPVNIRYIASCTAPPDYLHDQGLLLSELTEQLQGIYIELPPLHQRKSDIPALVNHFLHAFVSENGGHPKEMDEEAMALLLHYDWPGDVYELKQMVKRLTLNTSTKRLGEQEISRAIQNAQAPPFYGDLATWTSNTDARQDGIRRAPTHHLHVSRYHVRPKSTPHLTTRLLSHASQQPRQKTLRRSIVIYGQGLQSGLKTGIILSPLPPNSGIVFSNITTGETLPASIDFVESTDFSTSLRRGRVTTRTVEHLMSVLHAYRISNLLIKLSNEVPIMDGSATDFCEFIETVGMEEQDAVVEEFVVDRCYHIGDLRPEAKSIAVEPYDGFQVTYRLDYPQPLGVQEFTYEHRDGASYRREVAPARTFGFVKDVESLHDLGLVAGGRLNNVILLDGEKIVNSAQLRFPNECARHKVLDIIGDLYLLGKPLRGHVRANMTGHTENAALVKKLHDTLVGCA